MLSQSNNEEQTNLEDSSKYISSKNIASLKEPTIKNPEYLVITPDSKASKSKKKVYIFPILLTAIIITIITLSFIFTSAFTLSTPEEKVLNKFLKSIYSEDVEANKSLITTDSLKYIENKASKENITFNEILKRKNDEFKKGFGGDWYKDISLEKQTILSKSDKAFFKVLNSENKVIVIYQVIKEDNDYKVNFEP